MLSIERRTMSAATRPRNHRGTRVPSASLRHHLRTSTGPEIETRCAEAEAYGASISTLREILNRLSSEGLVLAEGQREGFEVTRVSAHDLMEIAALRLLLEGHALKESFASGDMEWAGPARLPLTINWPSWKSG